MGPKVALAPNHSKQPATLGNGSKTVAAAGTPERLVATEGVNLVESVSIFPLRSNTGTAYVGSSSTNDAQAAETPVVFNAPAGKKIDLYHIYVDVTVNGEGVRYETVN